MQLTDTFCYVFFTITVTAICVQAESQNQELLQRKSEKQISKRETAVIIDNFPLESTFIANPKVIYRRISKHRYRSPKPTYGPPHTKYGRLTATSRKPTKKQRGNNFSSKLIPINPKKRLQKPRHGSSKSPRFKAKYGFLKQMPRYFYNNPEPEGFGEPPLEFNQEYPSMKPTYAEPPIDSYGAPLKTTANEPYPTTQGAVENHYDNKENQYEQEPNSWQTEQYNRYQTIDNNHAYSRRRPTYFNSDANVFNDPFANDFGGQNNVFSHPFKYNHNNEKRNKRPLSGDNSKFVNGLWKAPHLDLHNDDQILVGGQNAEPPARYMPISQPSAPMYIEDNDSAPTNGFADSEVASSATISPYVNYKNSNMAFSPQNLNDAFSVVD